MKENYIVWIVVAVIAAYTVTEILEDPKVAAMRDCTTGAVDAVKQVECAKAIFGDENE